ncbi:Predicted DNA-binding protein, contains XRE-type HTH domain [Shimia gijangensis]|uniref:Predicted DNA-binding protein, contains XRE-type HTH domain n=2 Tax=Shimia gijangensis TaxID=1470563 RepID=A0A1M6TR71_9RHOB|nr:Predicted DNA-binding protein, contains XRE-type HTH domain [Shimia gijangensis]
MKLKALTAGQINSIIEDLHLSQNQAAELLSVSPETLTNLKTGKLFEFSLDALLGFMIKLGLDVEIIFTPTSDDQRPSYFVTVENKKTKVAT